MDGVLWLDGRVKRRLTNGLDPLARKEFPGISLLYIWTSQTTYKRDDPRPYQTIQTQTQLSN